MIPRVGDNNEKDIYNLYDIIKHKNSKIAATCSQVLRKEVLMSLPKYFYYYQGGDEIVHLFNSTPFLQENSTTLIIEKDKNSNISSRQLLPVRFVPMVGKVMNDDS